MKKSVTNGNVALKPTEQELREIEDDVDSVQDEDVEISDFVGSIDIFRVFMNDMSKYKLLSPEEEYTLAKKYKETGDIDAKNELINRNLRLVIKIAKRYQGKGADLIDLIQEGSLGLIKGIEMFEPDKGFKLSTYCTWWVRQAITRYLANNSSAIRIPVHLHERLMKYNRFIENYTRENGGKYPSDEEIAEAVGVKVDQVPHLEKYNNKIVSLDLQINNGDGDSDSTLGDFIADDSQSPEDAFSESALRSDIELCLNDLTERERNIIIMRFGLDGRRPMTLEEVGTYYSLTRERIRQIECRALRKLKNPKRARLLKDYIPGAKMPTSSGNIRTTRY